MTTRRQTASGLRPGMLVRFPVDVEREDGQHRDFRLGRTLAINEASEIVQLETEEPQIFDMPITGQHERFLHLVERCHILTPTDGLHLPTEQPCRVLAACKDEFSPGEFAEYYIDRGGAVSVVPESELQVSWTRQDPSPRQQLERYELHNPRPKDVRDFLVKRYAELQNATFGMEALIGSRVMLLAHQAEVVTRVLGDVKGRYILADEVGLGKTIEACIIIKALRAREPELRTLIVVPDSLIYQWRSELNDKFWLEFAVVTADCELEARPNIPLDGLLLSTETLATSSTVWSDLRASHAGLLVVDEAHQVRKDPALYDRIQALSAAAERVLVLSATPIQRRADEYFALLALLDPTRYRELQAEDIQQIIEVQEPIRDAIAYLQPALVPGVFKVEMFLAEMQPVVERLQHDAGLQHLLGAVTREAANPHRALQAATAVVSYISENYRIERRVIRNRRTSLKIALPPRQLDERFRYTPTLDEAAVLAELAEFSEHLLREAAGSALHLEYARLLLHAAASSPHALAQLLRLRQEAAPPDAEVAPEPARLHYLITPASPRSEQKRIQALLESVPVVATEPERLRSLLRHVDAWLLASEAALDAVGAHLPVAPSGHRLLETLRALDSVLATNPSAKVLVFSSWPATLAALLPRIEHTFGHQSVIEFRAGIVADALQANADRFQSTEVCRILLCDELGGEGRNFQVASTLIHVDLPWTPAAVEQRIGRVDRLGNTHSVTSLVPYAAGTIEHDLFRLWHEALALFTRSMSGMEIALEGILDELLAALATSPSRGLAELAPVLAARAEELRRQIELERFFEEGAIDHKARAEFQHLSETYENGRQLREPVLQWAESAGLTHIYDPDIDIVKFYPPQFRQDRMREFRYTPPNMEVAMLHDRRPRNMVITGTFSRHVAIQRDDLVFLAPSFDPWIDAIIRNALEADFARCTAVMRHAPDLQSDWDGFELLYSLSVDPTPLFAAGFSPVHLFRAQGYLDVATVSVLVTPSGQVLSTGHPVHQAISAPFRNGPDRHLARRSGNPSNIAWFREHYPPDQWHLMINRAFSAAETYLNEQLDYTAEAAQAETRLQQQGNGWQAASQWLRGAANTPGDEAALEAYLRSGAALVAGLRHPRRRLESVCFWVLKRVHW